MERTIIERRREEKRGRLENKLKKSIGKERDTRKWDRRVEETRIEERRETGIEKTRGN